MTGTTILIPTLETERLILRCPRIEDFEAYHAFRSSDRAAHVGGPCKRFQSFDKLGEIIGHWHLRGFGRWLVADRETDEPLGVVGLFHPDDWPEPEIAWSVFEAGEGRGVAYEAAVASRKYAYETLGWDRVISCVGPENLRSLALAQRMGATHEYTLDNEDIGPLQVWRHPGPETLQ